MWMYDCNDGDSDNFDVGPITCTSTKLEQNLSILVDDLQMVVSKLDKKILLPNMVGEEEDVLDI